MDIRRPEEAIIEHWDTAIADLPVPCLETVGVPLVDLKIGQCLWPTVVRKAFPSYLFCAAPNGVRLVILQVPWQGSTCPAQVGATGCQQRSDFHLKPAD